MAQRKSSGEKRITNKGNGGRRGRLSHLQAGDSSGKGVSPEGAKMFEDRTANSASGQGIGLSTRVIGFGLGFWLGAICSLRARRPRTGVSY